MVASAGMRLRAHVRTSSTRTAALGACLLLIRWQLRLAVGRPSSVQCIAAFYTARSPRRVVLLPGRLRR
jgi:hypothetical protein